MLNMDVVPKTLDEAVGLLFEAVQPVDRDAMMRSPSCAVHHTLGQWLRNNWSLWDQTMPLPRWFIENLGLGHADDMSGVILESLWCKVRGQPYDLALHVAQLRAHWLHMGKDPRNPQ
jgi:hypothetical protein